MSGSPTETLPDEDGYRLWLRYERVASEARLNEYRARLTQVVVAGSSASASAARAELVRGLHGLLGAPIEHGSFEAAGLLAGTPESLPALVGPEQRRELEPLGSEGFAISERDADGSAQLLLLANSDVGVLYGVFHLLRQLQTERALSALPVRSAPRARLRMLNHWDNLDRTIERGYAGFSLWDWHLLPGYLAPRYTDYARANASLGINALTLTNVNADARILTPYFLQRVAALADTFRPYGMRVFLTARFNAPVEIGGAATADPRAPEVARFWNEKVAEIYRFVPDFGGFLVKANSEGQPGPQDYGRTHAEGANLLARAVAPHGGVVIWRAFVYDKDVPEDRAKQAYQEFVPLDGAFDANVAVQVKNGPIDFQPREPLHPLFGAMPATPLFLELQLTQEYLGFATHLAYLGTLFEEVLSADTYARGPGSTLSRVADGSLHGHALTGMAAVANIGHEQSWCGHPFAAANWYAFGRLCWDPSLSAGALAEEWLRMTFGNQAGFVEPARRMMLESREAVVDYMTPLGLCHLMGKDHHYGPAPWLAEGRADWTSVYYHRADAAGLGFDRSRSGSDAVSLYAPEVAARFGSRSTCPEELLLWFHHVGWGERLSSGRTLWEELCHRYDSGVAHVASMSRTWGELERYVDGARHAHVAALLRVQEQEARWWRDACLRYFQTFSRLPWPAGSAEPAESLAYYKSVQHQLVPGI